MPSSAKTPCLQHDNAIHAYMLTYFDQTMNSKVPFRLLSRVVILVSTTAEVRQWLNRISISDPAAYNPVVCVIACRHVLAATNTLRRIDRKVPIRKNPSCCGSCRSTCCCCCRRGRRGTGRVGGVGFCTLGIEVCRELCGVVEALDAERRKYLFLYGSSKGVSFCWRVGIEEGKGGVGKVNSEWVVG